MKRILLISLISLTLMLLVSCGCTTKVHTHVYDDEYVCEICNEKAKQSVGLDYSHDSENNAYVVIGMGNCEDKNVTIPLEHDGLPIIGIEKYAFYNEDIEGITIPSTITAIADFAISNCTKLKEINVSTDNEKYKSIDGNLYTSDGKKLVQYSLGKAETAFEVPNTVTEIGASAFSNSPALKSITMGDSTKTIGASAFLDCKLLENITLGKVEAIKEYAFYGCTSLESISIPSTTTKVGLWVFYGCTSLTINCEAKEKPEGWHANWNEGGCPVVWEYKG